MYFILPDYQHRTMGSRQDRRCQAEQIHQPVKLGALPPAGSSLQIALYLPPDPPASSLRWLHGHLWTTNAEMLIILGVKER